jgi:glycosyltransferase involved in cell wall biosynthesis
MDDVARGINMKPSSVEPAAITLLSGKNLQDKETTRVMKPTVTCVIPAFNEGENLAQLIPMLDETLRAMSGEYSILVIDDGSADDTSAVAIALAAQYPIRLLQLSRNFGKENAITAGLDHVDSDVVILMDADCQHPVDLLPVFMKHWHAGVDMIYGVIRNRQDESALKRRLTKWFYALLSRTASIPIIPDAGDFRLFDRQVVEALRALPERTRFMKGLYSWVGFTSIGIYYQPAPRHAGRSQFRLRSLTKLAVTGLTSFSDVPLRVWGSIGAVVSLISILYGVYIMVRTLAFGIDVPGWATLTVAMTFIGGVQLFSIGILGEYIGRIFTEVKGRPVYLIRRKHGFNQPNQVS